MSIADLASLASSIAVLVSLLFLALQIRQSNRNQRSLMQQGRSARNVELLSRLSDPRVSDVISRAANGETLTDQDCFVLYGYLTSVFWSYEDCFFQFHLGMLDPKSWASDGITLRRLLGKLPLTIRVEEHLGERAEGKALPYRSALHLED